MNKLNISKEQVGNVVKTGFKVVLGALAILPFYLTKEDIATVKNCIGEATYSDAVNAIMNSSMFDSTKTKVMTLLKRDESADYYKAVIAVAKSNMFDSNKVQTIEALSEN